MSEIRIRPKHAQQLGLCLNGCRSMAPSLGLDFRRWCKEGIPISEIADTPDTNLQRMIALAQKEAERNGQGRT